MIYTENSEHSEGFISSRDMLHSTTKTAALILRYLAGILMTLLVVEMLFGLFV